MMIEFIVKFRESQLLIKMDSVEEFIPKVFQLLEAQGTSVSIETVKLQAYHQNFGMFYDITPGDIPHGGIIKVSVDKEVEPSTNYR